MSSIKRGSRGGFTLIELMVVLAIITILAGVTFSAISRGGNLQTLDGASSTLVSLLSEARADTLASENDMAYGVHVEDGQFVLFSGSYAPDAEGNIVEPVSGNITVDTELVGGSDFTFEQLSGEAAVYGTTTLSLFTGGATSTRTVVVSESGAIDVQ